MFNAATLTVGCRLPAPRPPLWRTCNTYAVIMALIYLSMNGMSPFANENMYMRFSSAAAGTSLIARALAGVVYLFCGVAILANANVVTSRFLRLKALAALPLLAMASCLWSQAPVFSLHQGVILLGMTLFAIYFICEFTVQEQIQLLMVCGAMTAIASIVFAVFLPSYGLDHLGGHDNAWKGIFTAKNVCGQTMLLLLTPALYLQTDTSTARLLKAGYIAVLGGVIIMSQAMTSWMFLGLLFVCFVGFRLVASFKLIDLLTIVMAAAAAIALIVIGVYSNYSLLLGLIGKDPTLTGRTELWAAVLVSILKHPALGYGYCAFWRGLDGESANTLLSIKNFLAQPQNGFLDVLLQLGLSGFIVVAISFFAAIRDSVRSLYARRTPRVQWYVIIIMLTVLFNLVETYLATPVYIGWLLYLAACYGVNDVARRRQPADGYRLPA
jgi:exopolysaccharide production protein ExoQ